MKLDPYRRGWPAAAWALAPIAGCFVESIYRMGGRAARTVASGLTAGQTAILIILVAGFAWGEGFLALQRRLAPFVVRRAFTAGLPGWAIAAGPLYALGLVDRSADVVRRWLGLGMILAAVVVVRMLPSPWRGLIDAGVATALAWGLVALLVETVRMARSTDDPVRLPVVLYEAAGATWPGWSLSAMRYQPPAFRPRA